MPRLFALSLATFVTVTAEMVPAGLLSAMSVSLGVSQARIGLLVSIWAVTIAIVTLPLAQATDRFDRRSLLCGSLLVFATANLGTAFAPTYAVAALSRIAAAGAHGLFWSVVVVYAASTVAEQLVGRALAIVLAGPTVAGVVGVPLGTMIGEQVGWRATFGVIAVLMVASSTVLWLLLPGSSVTPQSRGRRPGWDASARAVLLVSASGALVLVGHFMLYTYVSPLLTSVAGFDSGAVGMLLLVFGLAGAVGLVLSGPLSDRAPRSALTITATAFAISAASLGLLGHDKTLSILLVTVWGALIGMYPPVLQARVLRVASEQFRGTASAIVIASLNVGIAGGAALGGQVLERSGPGSLAPVAASSIALAVIVLASIRSMRMRSSRHAAVG